MKRRSPIFRISVNRDSDSGLELTVYESKRFIFISLVASVITLALYARSLPLPFYSDDLLQMPWLRSATWAEFWTQVTPYGYYRPLVFAIWKILPTSPVILRSLNLALHALAATFVGCLADVFARRGQWMPGVAAAAFFATYPFAYQVVPWVSATFYPLVVTLSVVAVVAYLRARAGNHPAWWAVSLAATVLAPLAHENGLLVGLLVALCEYLTQEKPHRWTWLLTYLAIGALSGTLWWVVRASRLGTLALDAAGLMENATFLVQGISFPLAPIAQFFDGATWVIWAIAIATVTLLTWAAGRRGRYALVWFVLSILPVWVMMRPDWLADAPRFLYSAGVGAALLWGFALARFTGIGRGGLDKGLKPLVLKSAMRTILLLAALAPGAVFVWEGVTWHLRGGAPIREAVEMAQASPDDSLLLVNLPDRLAPGQSLYPRNHGGANLLPPQAPTEEIVGAPLGSARPQDAAITAGWLLPSVDYVRTTYGPTPDSPDSLAALIAEHRRVAVTEYVDTDIHLREAGQVLRDSPSGPPLARFGDGLVLVSASTLINGEMLRLELVWLLEMAAAGDETMFVHVADSGGTLIAQADGDPLMGLYPMTLWLPGTAVLDVRYARLGDGIPAEVYVGVWQPGTGERLEAFARNGARFPDDRVLVYNLP